LRTAFALEAVPIDVRVELPCKPIRATYRSAIYKRLIVIDKDNGGKSDALNCAIDAGRFPLVCAIDADTLILPDALLRLVRPFLSDVDVVAARRKSNRPSFAIAHCQTPLRTRQHRADQPAKPDRTPRSAPDQAENVKNSEWQGLGRARKAFDVMVHAVSDPDAEVRIQALKGLRELGDASALPAVIKGLDDERWEVRSEAARTAGMLGAAGSVEAIAKLLDDDAEWVRHNAALALGRCGPAGTAALRVAASRGNHAASNALAEARLTVVDAGAPGHSPPPLPH
jgi:glycosyltransferase involved in cell wall biosynthesis